MKILVILLIIAAILMAIAGWACCATAGKADEAAEKAWREKYGKRGD